MVVRRPEWVRRPGVCQRVQRRRLAAALARVPAVQASCWNHTTRVRAQHTRATQAALASKSAKGRRVRPLVLKGGDVVLDDGVGAHVRVALSGGAPLVGPVAPVAPGVAGEQRALRPGGGVRGARSGGFLWGQSAVSTNSVRSATAAPGRTSPLRRIARCQRLSVTGALAMALSMASLRRATRENPTLRTRAAAAIFVEQPAESVRNTTARATRASSSPARCPAATASGSRRDRRVEERDVVVDVVGGRVAGAQQRRQRVAVVAETQQRMEPVAALVMRRRAGFCSGSEIVSVLGGLITQRWGVRMVL